jgi:hypothetical protein
MNNVAEEATGICQQGSINFQDRHGKISLVEAKKRFLNNEEVEVPGAGAGSYDEVFKLLGFNGVKLVESCSSAGDWQFNIRKNKLWVTAIQLNRYPYYGFKYIMGSKI